MAGPEVVQPAGDEPEEAPEKVLEDAEAVSKKQAKKMMDLLRGQYENTAAFADSLFQDSRLQRQCRILVDVLQFLHAEYASDLESHAAGQQEQQAWQGRRTRHLFGPAGIQLHTGPRVQQMLESGFSHVGPTIRLRSRGGR